jgi:4-hydroxy-tetrahydrodipicolinate synthase
MNRAELQRKLKGIICATVTPFDDNFEINLGQMHDDTQWWVENGLVEGKACIKVASVMGEVPQLRDDEWPKLVETTVKAAAGRVPIISGIHGKETKRSIEDALQAQDLGATGIQVSPPVWNDPNQDDILRYFEAISDAIEIGVMVYNTPWMAHGEIMPDTFHKMADFEHIVAIKWCMPRSYDYDEAKALAPKFNLLENGKSLGRIFELGGKGFLDEQALANPQYELQILEHLEAGRYDEGQAMWDAISVPLGKFYQKLQARSGGQARLKKGVMNAMGHPVGSMRPPSLPLNDQEMDELRDLLRSFGWQVPEPAAAAAD